MRRLMTWMCAACLLGGLVAGLCSCSKKTDDGAGTTPTDKTGKAAASGATEEQVGADASVDAPPAK